MKKSSWLRLVLSTMLLCMAGTGVGMANQKIEKGTKKMTTAYVGCRTTAKRYAHGKGISRYTIDEKGNWKLEGITKTLDNPAWLVLDQTKKYLYTVHGDAHEVSAFRIKEDGDLEFLDTVDSQGKNPVYGVVTPNNQFLLVASLQGGAVASLPIRADGSLGEAVSVEHFEGPKAGGISHAHACVLDRTGKWLLVPTQARGSGYDRVWVLVLDENTGKLTRTSYAEARKYDEPRHLVFSKDNRHVYLVNEKASTLRVFDFDDQKGQLTARQVVPTLQDTYVGPNMASAIVLSRDGKQVYVSNRIKEGIPPEGEGYAGTFRGQETVVSYTIDPKTGLLGNPQWTNCEGYTPRFMTLTPEGQLLVANMDSDTLQFFAPEGKNGQLHFTGKTVKTESPCTVVFR